MWAIELKRLPNKPTPAQVQWLDVLSRHVDRADVIWVPEGMADFLAELVAA